MYIATTPHLTFTLGIDTQNIKTLRLSFYQANRVRLTLTEDDVNMTGNNVDVTFTQEQTFLFDNGIAYAQFRVKLNDDTVEASNIVSIDVEKVFDKEIL